MDILTKLPEKLKNALLKANLINSNGIRPTSSITLKKIGATDEEITQIRSMYTEFKFPIFISASQCKQIFPQRWKRISMGCTSLDLLTKNGIPTRGITEFSGESSVGKSQLCLQLSLMVQLPETAGGLGKNAVFICTEDAFPTLRLQQMIEHFKLIYGSLVKNIEFSNQIFIEHVFDVDNLKNCIFDRLSTLVAQKNIGLIIIDSIGGIFRLETIDTNKRAADMRDIVHRLLKISDEYGSAVVCVNQVTSVICDEDTGGQPKLIPCLGLAWANLITTRIQLYRTKNSFEMKKVTLAKEYSKDSTLLNVRRMEIGFSSELLTGTSAEFLITPDGICDVPNIPTIKEEFS